jgi:hypothetical protein
MKINKLPKMVILKPFASIPKIMESQTFKVIKYTTYVLIAIVLLGSVMYLNVIRDQTLYLQNKPVAEAPQDTGTVLEKTTAIIVRDGLVPVAVAKKYAVWIYEAAAKYSVDPVLMLSVMYTESKFNYKATSPTGPIGLFQIAASMHKDKTTATALFDPHNNIDVGAQILSEYRNLSKSTVETLLRYNGTLGEAPDYAYKVLNIKKRYDNEILKAVAL